MVTVILICLAVIETWEMTRPQGTLDEGYF